MKTISFEQLEKMMKEIYMAVGLSEKDAETVVKLHLEKTKRGVGHHDVADLPSRIERISKGVFNPHPEFKKLAAFKSQESWDGGNGMGELTCSFAMERAIALAQEYGMGLCTIRNSSHFLASSLYTTMAAEAGCIGIIIAKDYPSMGMPGYGETKLLGHSPNGFAFPTEEPWPVMLDGCLAYVSGHGELHKAAAAGRQIPEWWGVDKDGNPTTDPVALLAGTRYPIGAHKGFGYAILCEMLTGVLSQGPILDQEISDDGEVRTNCTHTAIAIKADALMPLDVYKKRSSTLIERIRQRTNKKVRIPGQRSYEAKLAYEQAGEIELDDAFFALYDKYVKDGREA